MGCCSGRFFKPPDPEPVLTKTKNQEVIDKTNFSSVHSNYFSNRQSFYKKTFNVTSVENKKLNDELEDLSSARESINIEKISKLLISDTAIVMEPDAILHTWAENPKTISTLAAIQLGIFASDKDIGKTPKFLQDIIKYKVVDTLADFVRTEDRDKYEAGVLALSFMTDNNNEITEMLLKKNVISVLIKLMRDRKEGLKATAALCCRNLYVGRPVVQKVFIREGGSELLVGLLDSDDSVTVFETILNVLDLLLDSEDTVQPDVKKHLISLGIQDHLERISRETSRYEQETIKEAEKLGQLFD